MAAGVVNPPMAVLNNAGKFKEEYRMLQEAWYRFLPVEAQRVIASLAQTGCPEEHVNHTLDNFASNEDFDQVPSARANLLAALARALK